MIPQMIKSNKIHPFLLELLIFNTPVIHSKKMQSIFLYNTSLFKNLGRNTPISVYHFNIVTSTCIFFLPNITYFPKATRGFLHNRKSGYKKYPQHYIYLILIHFLGHFSAHWPHPVHLSSNTLCFSFNSPSIASNLQVFLHMVQPIHSSSLIYAFFLFVKSAYMVFVGQTSAHTMQLVHLL